MQNIEHLRVKRAANTPFRVIEGEALVVQSREGMVNVLNPVGTDIWALCDGTLTVAEIATRIGAEYALSREAALADTLEFVGDLRDKGMVELLEGG